jgi:uncharacterized protein (TIGR02145 family)
VVLSAQNGVTVTNLAVTTGSPTTVTFDVSWTDTGMPAVWSDSVWVFVDFNDAGVMKRLPLLAGATLTATSAPGVGKVIEVSGNDKGVWVVGNARSAGNFSATVQLLTGTANVAGACAYGSNYPPVGEYTTAAHLSFTGTAPYEIVLKHKDGSIIVRKSESPYSVPLDYTVQSFTDKTGAPGIIKCLWPTVYTLTASASSFCTAGAGVTFGLSGTENGLKYQLYRGATAVAALTGAGSAATFSSAFNVAGVYTARAIADDVYCTASMSGAHALSENSLPTIIRTGGDAGQTVPQNTAITTITYTGNNASSIALSSGGFPTGVTGSAAGTVFTISGTASASGTFGYTVTAFHTNGCSAASSGTITVFTTPPGAASTQTWVIGDQTWSAPLQKAQTGCKDTTYISSTPSYRSSGLNIGSGYLYNGPCISNRAAELCPSPWRVPTRSDFCTLITYLGGTCTNGSQPGIRDILMASTGSPSWGGVYGGYAANENLYNTTSRAYYWAADLYYSMNIYSSGFVGPQVTNSSSNIGYQVRCVR